MPKFPQNLSNTIYIYIYREREREREKCTNENKLSPLFQIGIKMEPVEFSEKTRYFTHVFQLSISYMVLWAGLNVIETRGTMRGIQDQNKKSFILDVAALLMSAYNRKKNNPKIQRKQWTTMISVPSQLRIMTTKLMEYDHAVRCAKVVVATSSGTNNMFRDDWKYFYGTR